LNLPAAIRSRSLDGVNGLVMHVLEAGEVGRPCLILLHGFPELAYSWRQVMPILAESGFYVVAPDQRGYGRTTGWRGRFEDDIAPFGPLNLVTDIVALVQALGLNSVAAVVGHDFGSPVAAYAGLIRPDIFRAVMLMSAPFAGPPGLTRSLSGSGAWTALDEALAALNPPRRHYRQYYSMREAEADMLECPEGLHAFLRAYYHMKSGDWADNAPHALSSAAADAFAVMPAYYVMDRANGMAETVRAAMPSPAEIAACAWLPDAELAVYASEFARTGFQGALNWYRCTTDPDEVAKLRLYAGRTLDVPTCFIGGDHDWGVHQTPGAFAAMSARACTRFLGSHLVPGAGHWVQQEAPEDVAREILRFLQARS
jgi:pimeloyl-ACP methyl ester carboxylesterase